MIKLMSTGAVCGLECIYTDDAGTRREWLEYWCSRWIHEDWIDDNDVGNKQCISRPLCSAFVILKIHVNVAKTWNIRIVVQILRNIAKYSSAFKILELPVRLQKLIIVNGQ